MLQHRLHFYISSFHDDQYHLVEGAWKTTQTVNKFSTVDVLIIEIYVTTIFCHGLRANAALKAI